MTVETIPLKEHFESLLREMEKRYEQRFDAQEKAVLKAEVATEKRLEGVNEFRKTLSDQQSTFVSKEVSDARFKSLENLVAVLTAQQQQNSGRGAGRNDVWLVIVAIASPVIAIAAIFFKH